jgi:hypothetical protein
MKPKLVVEKEKWYSWRVHEAQTCDGKGKVVLMKGS